MKVRNGFVSNSSSSSFLIVFAKVSNTIAQEISNKYLNMSEFWLTTGKELLHHFKEHGDISGTYINIDCDWAGVYKSIPIEKIDPNSNYILYKYYGDEGDGEFINEKYDEYNYDIDLDFFNKEIQSLYEDVIENNGFEDIFKSYGAGRNG